MYRVQKKDNQYQIAQTATGYKLFCLPFIVVNADFDMRTKS